MATSGTSSSKQLDTMKVSAELGHKITLPNKARAKFTKPIRSKTVISDILPSPSEFYKHGDIMGHINRYLLKYPKKGQDVLDWIDEHDMVPQQFAEMSTVSYLLSSPKLHEMSKKALIDSAKTRPEPVSVFIDLMPFVNDKYDMILFGVVRAFSGQNAADVLKPHEITSLLEHFEGVNLVSYTWLSRYRDESAPVPSYMKEERSGVSVLDADYSSEPRKLTIEYTRSSKWQYASIPSCQKWFADEAQLIKLDVYRRLMAGFSSGDRDADIERFRKFGPCNPFFGDAMNQNEQRHMLKCTVHDYDVDDEELSFNGRCEYSGLKIINQRRAVRLPKKQGGWETWFASTDYLVKYIQACQSDDMLWELEMAKETQKLLDEYGIYESE